MSYRLLGAILIISGCGGFGMSLVSNQRHQENLLHRLISAIQFMQWELQYRLTPLPELLAAAGKQGGGEIAAVLQAVSRELSAEVMPDAASCMQKILRQQDQLPRTARIQLRKLGSSLGCFDLAGQLEGLKEVERSCQAALQDMEKDRPQRFRCYKTRGFCGGLALVILFI